MTRPAGDHSAATLQLLLQLFLQLRHHLLHPEDHHIVILGHVRLPQVLSGKCGLASETCTHSRKPSDTKVHFYFEPVSHSKLKV